MGTPYPSQTVQTFRLPQSTCLPVPGPQQIRLFNKFENLLLNINVTKIDMINLHVNSNKENEALLKKDSTFYDWDYDY